MPLRTELGLIIAGLVALTLLLVFGAIGLFARMGPAIERILLRNDTSIQAAEEVLEVLASTPGEAVPPAERRRVDAALRRARDNVTEPGEALILAAIDEHRRAALDGPRATQAARMALVAAVRDLIALNRAAMQRVDRDARRLGKAGAWASVLVGLVSVGLILILVGRMGKRVVRPIHELRGVLADRQAGDRYRRCGSFAMAPEFRQVLSAVNELLDEVDEADAADAVDEANAVDAAHAAEAADAAEGPGRGTDRGHRDVTREDA